METSHFNMWDNADCWENFANKNENRDIFAKSTQTRMTKIKLSVFNYCHWSWKPELWNNKNWIKRLIWGWLLTALRAPKRSLGMTSVDGVSRHRQASPRPPSSCPKESLLSQFPVVCLSPRCSSSEPCSASLPRAASSHCRRLLSLLWLLLHCPLTPTCCLHTRPPNTFIVSSRISPS